MLEAFAMSRLSKVKLLGLKFHMTKTKMIAMVPTNDHSAQRSQCSFVYDACRKNKLLRYCPLSMGFFCQNSRIGPKAEKDS